MFPEHIWGPELVHHLFEASSMSGVSSSESRCHSHNGKIEVRKKVALFNLHLPTTGRYIMIVLLGRLSRGGEDYKVCQPHL